MWNNTFNLVVIEWLNQNAFDSAILNKAIYYIAESPVIKGFPAMGLLWYFWFRDADTTSRTRQIIIGTFIGCFLALIIATIINYSIPYQPRPFENEQLNFEIKPGFDITLTKEPVRHGWVNTFPSHHASMFFALATGVWLISRTAGYLSFVYVLLVILTPRVYLGLHYPLDVIAGALIGIACTALVNQRRIQKLYEAHCALLLDRHPAIFQTALLMLTFEMGVMFNDAQGLVKAMAKYLF